MPIWMITFAYIVALISQTTLKRLLRDTKKKKKTLKFEPVPKGCHEKHEVTFGFAANSDKKTDSVSKEHQEYAL